MMEICCRSLGEKYSFLYLILRMPEIVERKARGQSLRLRMKLSKTPPSAKNCHSFSEALQGKFILLWFMPFTGATSSR